MDDVQATVDQLYKTHFGKLIASLLSLSTDIDLSTAEDIVHDGFSTALIDWRKKIIPSNPAGWLFTVCRNNALNQIKRSANSPVPSQQENAYENTDDAFSERASNDLQLRMLFISANPFLPPKSQIVVTLKYVANFKIEAVARVLGMTVDGVDQILSRARQKIKTTKLFYEPVDLATWRSRLPMVNKIIYLIFNEGYKSSWGKDVVREELCEEALILNHELLKTHIGTNENKALHALMLFNSARIRSRFSAAGEIIELEKQDRSLWDADLITLATDFLNQSKADEPSSYHIEASIAYLHCSAQTFERTNWALIVKLYEHLLRASPNPFAEVNYAIALFYSGERERAFDILYKLLQHPYLHQYTLLNAALGKLLLLSGDYANAKDFLQRAHEQTIFEAEKKLIAKLITACK